MVRFVFFLQRHLDEHLSRVLDARGLNHSAWSLLIMIHSDPDQSISPSVASEALRQSRPHITRIADDLVERDWIERVPDATDRRAVVLRLTPAGRAALEELLPALWAEYERLVAGFSAADAQRLSALLRGWLVDLESADAARTVVREESDRG